MRQLTTRSRAHLLVAGVVGAGLATQTFRQLWSADVWQHAASISAFEAHPFDPNHPLSVGLVDDPYFLNPWGLIWGLFARLTGLDVFSTLVVSGLVNLLLIGTGLYRLTTRLSPAPLAPALAIVSLLLLWGPTPWRWSGYPSLNSIGFGLPYPSFFALALFLFGVAAAIDITRLPTKAAVIVLLICVTLAVLSHALTGAALILSVSAIVVAPRIDGSTHLKGVGVVAGVVTVAVGLALLWPFGHLWDLVGAPAAFDDINRSVNRNLAGGAISALIAAPLVLKRVGSGGAGPLRAMFFANAAVTAVGFLGGPASAGRFLPFALLAVQLAFADVVARAVEQPDQRAVMGVAAALLLAVGLVGSRGALARLTPSQVLTTALEEDDRLERASRAAARVPQIPVDDPVAIAGDGVDARLLVANGVRVVSPPYPVATLSEPELERRESDSQRFLLASTGDQRAIRQRYGVDVLVVPQDTASALRLGPLIASSPTLWVIDLSGLR